MALSNANIRRGPVELTKSSGEVYDEAAMNLHDSFYLLFNPRSVAVIGASSKPMKMGHQCLLSLREGSFAGPIYPIHPQEKEILGIPAYPDLEHVPGEVDLAILVLPASEALAALAACQRKNVRSAVIITAGFRETESPAGAALQGEMAALANQTGIKIIGPNTSGMVNVHARLNASFTPIFSRLKPGPISVISQSGGVAHLIGYQALDEGIGLGKVVGLGNRCNVEFADLLPFFEGDPHTRCLILYIEGLEDPKPLVAGIRNFVSHKPIVAMKAGRYSSSQKAARSHTGSMAGRYELYEASLKQAGAIVRQAPDELLDLAKILVMVSPPRGRNIAVMSFQAGPGILLTDEIIRQGLSMASFLPRTQEAVNQLLPPLTIRSNPVDLAFAREEGIFERLLGLLLQDNHVDALVIFLLEHPFMTPAQIAGPLLRKKKSTSKPILLCVNSPRGIIEKEMAEVENVGIPVYPLPQRAVRALKGLVEYGEVRKRMKAKGEKRVPQ